MYIKVNSFLIFKTFIKLKADLYAEDYALKVNFQNIGFFNMKSTEKLEFNYIKKYDYNFNYNSNSYIFEIITERCPNEYIMFKSLDKDSDIRRLSLNKLIHREYEKYNYDCVYKTSISIRDMDILMDDMMKVLKWLGFLSKIANVMDFYKCEVKFNNGTAIPLMKTTISHDGKPASIKSIIKNAEEPGFNSFIDIAELYKYI